MQNASNKRIKIFVLYFFPTIGAKSSTVRMRSRPEVKILQQLKPSLIVLHNLSSKTGNNVRQLKFIGSNFLKKKYRRCAAGIFYLPAGKLYETMQTTCKRHCLPWWFFISCSMTGIMHQKFKTNLIKTRQQHPDEEHDQSSVLIPDLWCVSSYWVLFCCKLVCRMHYQVVAYMYWHSTALDFKWKGPSMC